MKRSASKPGLSLFYTLPFDSFTFLYTDWETEKQNLSLSLNPILTFMAYLLELKVTCKTMIEDRL